MHVVGNAADKGPSRHTFDTALLSRIFSTNGVTDADPSNNQAIGFNVSMATQNTDIEVTVNITTDAYGSETTWNLKNSAGLC